MNLCRITMYLSLLAALLVSVGCTNLSGQAPGNPDTDLERAVMGRLTEDTITANQGFGVRAEQGSVTLYGSVPNESVRLRALGIVRGTPGVSEVQDELKRW